MVNLFYREFYKRNLPHYQPENGSFFITTRLVNSLPKHIILDLKDKRNMFLKNVNKLSEVERNKYQQEFSKNYFTNFDELLMKYQKSPSWLINEKIANTITENIFHWDKIRYKLFTYCIMPNHIHIILQPMRKGNFYVSLAEIMFGLKSYTANKCNKILHRTGQFWHHESYDHYIRNENELSFYLDYVMNNPLKANLVSRKEDWKHSWIADEFR